MAWSVKCTEPPLTLAVYGDLLLIDLCYTLSMKHYIYRVTFPDMPWYYYGVHTDNGKPYYGSPTTHKWIWGMYESEVTILFWYETRSEAEEIEKRIIRHYLNDPLCLNEACGGQPSDEARRRGGSKGGRNQPKEVKKENGLKSQETHKLQGTGVYDPGHQKMAAARSAEAYGGFRSLPINERVANSIRANDIQRRNKTGRFNSGQQRRIALLPRSKEGKQNLIEAGKQNKGKKFWNNGKTTTRARECPGEGWVKGQLHKWWTNGLEETKSIERPGAGWERGRVKLNKK